MYKGSISLLDDTEQISIISKLLEIIGTHHISTKNPLICLQWKLTLNTKRNLKSLKYLERANSLKSLTD